MTPDPRHVAWARDEGAAYPAPPFDPPPGFDELGATRTDPSNRVYGLVREALFRHLGGWNDGRVDVAALDGLGKPRRIVVKPNWVRETVGEPDCVTTHGAVLRPIVDYLHLGFPDAEIVVADVPIQSADLAKVWAETGVDALREHYASLGWNVRFLDLRRERTEVDDAGFVLKRVQLPGDPRGYVEVSLGDRSRLEPVTSGARFSVDDYEPGLARCFHEPGRHAYLVARTVLEADLLVNVPKLKTHLKAGITVSMKNLIGINGEKGWIPHYRSGSPRAGGDEFPDAFARSQAVKIRVRNLLQGRSRRLFRAAYRAWSVYKGRMEKAAGSQMTAGGGWPGNDTLWRSVLDLVWVAGFGTVGGTLADTPQRHHLCIVDGIVAGEGEGPLTPSPKALGIVLCGSNPVSVDWAAATVAGLGIDRIAQLREAAGLSRLHPSFPPSPGAVRVVGPRSGGLEALPVTPLEPPAAWKGAVR
jgi:uncharacterized protein (DUF362 family)